MSTARGGAVIYQPENQHHCDPGWEWAVAPAEPQSIELTVFSLSGAAHTTHVLVCGSGQGDGDTGERRSEGSR